jgi:hypothetical protein
MPAGRRIFLMPPRLVHVRAEVRSARRAERKRDHSDQGGWQRRGSIGLRGGQPVRTIPSPPPSHRYRTPFSFFALTPPERGLFESLRVSVSVSKRWNGGSYAPVSASKISVPDSGVRDRFDDWVGGWQFGPFRLHHPVLQNCGFPDRLKTGRFCGDFRRYHSALSVSGDTCGFSGRF